jgi:hypothetical protein
MSENLWGEIPLNNKVTLPITILKEQATQLGVLTNRIIEGQVTSIGGQPNQVNYALEMVAPALANFRYRVLHITHDPVMVYPVTITAQNDAKQWSSVQCADEDQFKKQLSEILSSGRVRDALLSLISQSEVAAT